MPGIILCLQSKFLHGLEVSWTEAETCGQLTGQAPRVLVSLSQESQLQAKQDKGESGALGLGAQVRKLTLLPRGKSLVPQLLLLHL